MPDPAVSREDSHERRQAQRKGYPREGAALYRRAIVMPLYNTYRRR